MDVSLLDRLSALFSPPPADRAQRGTPPAGTEHTDLVSDPAPPPPPTGGRHLLVSVITSGARKRGASSSVVSGRNLSMRGPTRPDPGTLLRSLYLWNGMTNWRIALKFSVWLGTHSMSLTQVRCGAHLHVRMCTLLSHNGASSDARSSPITAPNWYEYNERLTLHFCFHL